MFSFFIYIYIIFNVMTFTWLPTCQLIHVAGNHINQTQQDLTKFTFDVLNRTFSVIQRPEA